MALAMAQASGVKWLLILSLCVVGCADGPPSVNGGPGSGVGSGSGGSGGSGGEGGGGGLGGIGGGGGQAPGACDNPSDLDAIENADGSLRNIARDCGSFTCGPKVQNPAEYESCVNICIDEQVQGLSTECTACYGAAERCSLESPCRLVCQNLSCSFVCLNCLDTGNCIQDLEECSGIPDNTCE
jgi:hypothetical protein